MDEYKREFSNLEQKYRAEFSNYSKINAAISCFVGDSESFETIRKQYDGTNKSIDNCIDTVTYFILQMENLLKTMASSTTKMNTKEKNTIMRLKQSYQDYAREYRQQKVIIRNNKRI